MNTLTPSNSRPPRKHLSPQQKLALIRESYEPGKQVAEVARMHNVGVSSLLKWRKQAIEGSLLSVKNDDKLVPASEVKALKKQVRELERLLGKKTAQVEILTEAIELAREKKFISRQPLPGIGDIVND